MKLLQRAPGICVFHHAVGGCQLALDARLILVRQLLQHVSAFVGLTALHQRSLARVTLHCRVQRFGAVQDIEPRGAKIQSSSSHVLQQLAHHGGIFGGSFAQSQYRLFAVISRQSQPSSAGP